MTSLQIRYFLKVADCMSFSQAAEELFVAQPSVSRQIQLLEKELGYPLFDRTQRRAIRLTEAGLVFRDCFRRTQYEYDMAQTTAAALKGDSPLRLRVGVGQNWDLTEPLLRFRERVRQLYPQAILSFENLPFLQLHHQLEAGQLDAIFCTRISVQKFSDLEIREIGWLQARAYVRSGLLRPADTPLRIEDFQGQTLLTLPEEEAPLALQVIQLQFYAHQVELSPRYLPNRDSIYQALLMGEGVAVFDERMWMGRDPRLTWIRMEDMVPLCMIWRESDPNPLIHLLAETMTQELEQHDTPRRPPTSLRRDGQ